MSFLTLPSGNPSFSQAIISLWFRVPSASIEAAQSSYVEPTDGTPVLFNGVIPLVIMGKQGSGTLSVTSTSEAVSTIVINGGKSPQQRSETHCIYGCDFPPLPLILYCKQQTTYWVECAGGSDGTVETKVNVVNVEPADSYKTEPSFIGIQCKPGREPSLYVNFESGITPDVAGNAFADAGIDPVTLDFTNSSCGGGESGFIEGTVVEYCYLAGGDDGTGLQPANSDDTHLAGDAEPPETTGGDGNGNPKTNDEDVSSLVFNKTGTICSYDTITVTPDEWHHVLVSVDMNDVAVSGVEGGGDTNASTSSFSQLFIALDDVNYTGNELSQNWVDGSPNGNAVITPEAFAFSGRDGATYSISGMSVPKAEMGIPGTATWVNHIYNVEMAEFQMWTGQMMNTASNRNLFIDVKTDSRTGDLVPVKPKVAADALGKPDIRLHGSGKWIKGRNSGWTGQDADGKPIPDGQFIPTGEIKRYRPDPSISS